MGCALHNTAHVSRSPLCFWVLPFPFLYTRKPTAPTSPLPPLSVACVQYIDLRGIFILSSQLDLSLSRSISPSAFAIRNTAVQRFSRANLSNNWF